MQRAMRVRWYVIYAVSIFMLIGNILFLWLFDTSIIIIPSMLVLLFLVLWAMLLVRDVTIEAGRRQQLLELIEGLLGPEELGELLDYVVDAVHDLVPMAEKCVIHLLDASGHRLHPLYSSRPEGDTPGSGMPADKGIAGQALQQRETQLVADVDEQIEFLPLRSTGTLRSLMVAPLYVGEKLLGTVSLNSSLPGVFTEKDRLSFTELTYHAAAAIHQKQMYTQALRDTHDVEAIINNLSEGLIVLDAHGRVLRHNAALSVILGADISDIEGQVVDPESGHAGLWRLARLLEDAQQNARVHHEYQVELYEPVHAVIKVNTAAVVDALGNWEQIITLQDQTEELDQIRSEADLFQGLTQEVKASLDSMRGFATLLVSMAGDAEAGSARAIRGQAARLSRLIRAASDISSPEQRPTELERVPTDLEDLVRDVLEQISTAAAAIDVSVRIDHPPDQPRVLLDAERLRLALLLLLEDGLLRAYPGGEIRMGFEVNLNELRVTSRDNGQPISEADYRRLLQGSYRLAEDGTSSIGTGLWLYLGRALIDTMGGHLWAPHGDESDITMLRFIVPL